MVVASEDLLELELSRGFAAGIKVTGGVEYCLHQEPGLRMDPDGKSLLVVMNLVQHVLPEYAAGSVILILQTHKATPVGAVHLGHTWPAALET
jgi:hypothetical protein